MSDIEKADSVVGITGMMNGSLAKDAVKNTYRRGAYCEWLGTHPTDEGFLTVANSIQELAAEVVRIDAASKAPPPDDGLPPWPWFVANGNNVYDAKGGLISCLHPNSQNAHCAPVVAAYLARCGSPAVRRLLAAFEVTDGRVNANSVEVCRDHEGGVRIHSHREYPTICWLTPRNGGGA